MGFQQQILDQLFVAFLTSLASLIVVLPANYIGIYYPFIGVVLIFIGTSYLFYLLYYRFYLKKFHLINPPYIFAWWVYLTMSFTLTFSIPTLFAHRWLPPGLDAYFLINSIIAFISFELYSYRLTLKNWIAS